MRATKPINVADSSQLSSKKCTLAFQCAMTSITNKSESGRFERLVFCICSLMSKFSRLLTNLVEKNTKLGKMTHFEITFLK